MHVCLCLPTRTACVISVESYTRQSFTFFPSLLIILVAQQQVDFLLLRRQAFLRAALRSKQMKVNCGLFLFTFLLSFFLFFSSEDSLLYLYLCSYLHRGCLSLFLNFEQMMCCGGLIDSPAAVWLFVGHDRCSAAPQTCQRTGPHDHRCQVWPACRYHQG